MLRVGTCGLNLSGNGAGPSTGAAWGVAVTMATVAGCACTGGNGGTFGTLAGRVATTELAASEFAITLAAHR